MAEPWTIARVLDWTRKDFAQRGLPSPRLDAELVIAHALSLARVQLYVRHDQPLTDAELAAIRALVERRRRREPVAYILGQREFYGRPFTVDPRVLVPRPETEGAVEAVLATLPGKREEATVRVLDVGTGSGALAVTLALERPDAVLDAVDLSPDALAVARANAARHGVTERVHFFEGALYEPVDDTRYDVIVSNPPYIPTDEIATLDADVREFEPRLALDGGATGDRVLGPLVLGARGRLIAGGALVVELGHDQSARALDLAREGGFASAEVRKDLAGIPRILVARG